MEAALRRLLVGLERPAHLDEWRRRVPLAAAANLTVAQRRDLPAAA
jgi:hypothetical protein